MNNPLKAISTIIELKPGKKYLLVFSENAMPIKEIHKLSKYFKQLGIAGIGLALRDGEKLEVIEVDERMN